MKRLAIKLQELIRANRGSAAVEFALVGPAFLAMFLGVVQLGLALQSYNAVRNLSADVARHVTVQYQTGNQLSNAQIRGVTVARAIAAPYQLDGDRMAVFAPDATTQRLAGAKEIALTIQYRIPTIIQLFGFEGPEISYERPIFVTTT